MRMKKSGGGRHGRLVGRRKMRARWQRPRKLQSKCTDAKKARLMELRDCELDGEIARLARWCDGGAGACVVPKNAKGFATRIGTKCHKESKSGIMCKEGR